MLKLIFAVSIPLMIIKLNPKLLYASRLGFLSSAALAGIGLTVPSIWNWSRIYGTEGLLPSRFLDEIEKQKFFDLFFLISLGAFLSGIFFLLSQYKTNLDTLNSSKLNAFEVVRKSNLIPYFGVITVLLLIGGLGKSILINDSYLDYSGSTILLRAASAIVPAAVIALTIGCVRSKHKYLNATLLFCIFLIQISKGSRTTLIIAVSIFMLLYFETKSRVNKVLLFSFLLLASQILISITFLARTNNSGILYLPNLFIKSLGSMSNTDSYIASFGRLLASITSWAPTVIASIPEGSARMIIRNANPLIGSGSDALSYSSDGLERLFPYTWIPLSSLGQIYGAFGAFALVVVMFSITSIAALSTLTTRKSNSLSVYSILAVGTYIFQFPLLFQYSSRIWIRVLWFMLLMCLLHILHKIKNSKNLSTFNGGN